MSSPKGRAGNGTYRTVTKAGYVLLFIPDHPMADCRGYVYEHRLVAAQKVGRNLKFQDVVHHVDGNVANNNPDNLEVLTRADHRFHHRSPKSKLKKPYEDNPLTKCACGCGAMFPKFDNSNRPRLYVSGHNRRIK